MKRILLCLALAVCLFSCSRGRKVIPADRMARIYEEIMVLDQWIRLTGTEMRKADTSLVYAPVLARYGYTVEDYYNSVEYYFTEPAEFVEILEKVHDRLDSHIGDLKLAEEGLTRREARLREIAIRTDFHHAKLFDAADSLQWPKQVAVELDSLGVYDIRQAIPDTVFEGPRFFLRDSLSTVADTLSTAQSPADSARNVVHKQIDHEKIIREIPLRTE
ncbi:MAG: DUF4296 domain-containing protein [Bacteroidales bacterium]|nr:DUF4296 domain-containing protein [Bacteroidales bacterium]